MERYESVHYKCESVHYRCESVRGVAYNRRQCLEACLVCGVRFDSRELRGFGQWCVLCQIGLPVDMY